MGQRASRRAPLSLVTQIPLLKQKKRKATHTWSVPAICAKEFVKFYMIFICKGCPPRLSHGDAIVTVIVYYLLCSRLHGRCGTKQTERLITSNLAPPVVVRVDLLTVPCVGRFRAWPNYGFFSLAWPNYGWVVHHFPSSLAPTAAASAKLLLVGAPAQVRSQSAGESGGKKKVSLVPPPPTPIAASSPPPPTPRYSLRVPISISPD
jgi:hypothetical protein